MRKLILLLVVLAFAAAPVHAQFFWTGSGYASSAQCVVNVKLVIPQWAQVICQDPDGITFSPSTNTNYGNGSYNATIGDWWGTAWDGWYSAISNAKPPDGKASTDPWAGAEYITGDPDGSPRGVHYEATDYAWHYVRTNTNITGTAVCTNLSGSAGGTIPQKFTIAFAPFWNNGAQVNVINIPGGGGPGAYAAGTDGGFVTMTGAQPFAFTNVSYNVLAPAFGTVTLHSRILRKGMMDIAGTYTGTITVTYQ